MKPNANTRRAVRARVAAAGMALAAAALLAGPASAWWSVGVGIVAPPVVVAPPPVYYAPPPVYYYWPPPAYYVPPAAYSPQPPAPPPPRTQSGRPIVYGTMCFAGVYTCPALPYTPVGAECVCPGLGAPSYGTVR